MPVPKPEPKYPTSYVELVFEFTEMRWEVIARFVEISGIIDVFIIDHIAGVDKRSYALVSIYWIGLVV